MGSRLTFGCSQLAAEPRKSLTVQHCLNPLVFWSVLKLQIDTNQKHSACKTGSWFIWIYMQTALKKHMKNSKSKTIIEPPRKYSKKMRINASNLDPRPCPLALWSFMTPSASIRPIKPPITLLHRVTWRALDERKTSTFVVCVFWGV